MSPWKLLGIEPCDDARAVKRAYARKLKLTKPDEKPEEFQQLHRAYKQALEIVERRQPALAEAGASQPVEQGAPLADEPVEDSTAIASARAPRPHAEEIRAEVPLAANSAAEAAREREAERRKRIDEYHRVLEQVDLLLQNDRLIGTEQGWRFLAESAYLLEDEFNWNLGLGVFERCARFNSEAPQKGRKHRYRPQVTANILIYCDMLFGWSENRGHLYRELGESLCDVIFDSLREEPPPVYPGQGLRGGKKLIEKKAAVAEKTLEYYFFCNLLARAFALLLDVFLVYVAIGLPISVAIIAVTGEPEEAAVGSVLMVSIAGYLLMAWLAESSRWQATPAKYLLGFRVTNRKFRRVGYLQGLWRIISFLLTVPLFKVGWLVNCFLGGNLLHDRMSRTYVIDYRKSRDEHHRRKQ